MPENLLSASVLSAVAEAIEKHFGKPINYPGRKANDVQPEEPAKVAMAVAYTNLLIDDSHIATQYHIKMLQSYFTVEEIHALTQFIREKAML
ncbi:hypothetical protein D770_21920 [Flammeovirgaceae bacterium 311]|nr:hypothetical protein D770_21920 [Flammeovirgaceae bacterium 311]